MRKESTNPIKIITVSGPDNSGKTTAIQKVFHKLTSDGGEITYYKACGVRLDDFHAIVVWHGKIIAFCSIGDLPDIPEDGSHIDDLQNIENGIKMANEQKVPFLDYLKDARFQDISLYANNADCLNAKGRKLFTKLLIEDTNKIFSI